MSSNWFRLLQLISNSGGCSREWLANTLEAWGSEDARLHNHSAIAAVWHNRFQEIGLYTQNAGVSHMETPASMVPPPRLERGTYWFEVRRSIHWATGAGTSRLIIAYFLCEIAWKSVFSTEQTIAPNQRGAGIVGKTIAPQLEGGWLGEASWDSPIWVSLI